MRDDVIARGIRRDLVARRKAMHAESLRWGTTLRELPRSEWPDNPVPPIRAWRSRAFLVMEYAAKDGASRLTLCRCQLADDGDWRQDISWDDIQRLKRECGYSTRCAVELYPPDANVVNVANMRHIWLIDPPAFMWSPLHQRTT